MLPTRLSTHESPLGRWEVIRRGSLPWARSYSAGYIALQGEVTQRREVLLPSGEPAIVVNFGTPFLISEPGSAQRLEIRKILSVMGPHDRPFVAENANSRELLVLHLTPVGAHVILG